MNFEHVLAHHLIDERLFHFWIGPVDLGLSPLILSMWGAMLIMTGFLTVAARAESRIGRLLRGMVEPTILYLRDENLEPIFGEHTDHFLPYFLTLFSFMMACNLFGLVPFTAGTTSNFTVCLSMAACTLVMILAVGTREQGAVGFFLNLVPGGVPWWLWPIMMFIEIVGLGAKCFALCVRLFANMVAGHVVSLSFIFLIFIFASMSHTIGILSAPAAIALALFAGLLDVFIAFLQAYIFMILTAVFVGMAVHPH